jgi:hypothetical protein
MAVPLNAHGVPFRCSYRYLASWEESEKRRLAMMQRRMELLSPLLEELNVRVYKATHHQLSFELGEIYSDMLEAKLERIEAKRAQKPDYEMSTAERTKCNNFCVQSAAKFQYFITLFDDEVKGTKAKPEDLEEENLRPFLLANFHIARLWGKNIGSNPMLNVEMMKKSLQKYEWVTRTAKAIGLEKVKECFGQELAICEQMAELLPEKINHAHYNNKLLS